MKAFSIQTSSALQAPRSALQRCLSWLAATPLAVGLCLAAPPNAQAVSFTDGNAGTNPFFYSNWVPSESAEKAQVNPTSIRFSSSGVGTDTLTSGLTSMPYKISFNYSFTDNDPGSAFPVRAFYQICGNSGCSEIGSYYGHDATGIEHVTLASGQSLIFGIENNDTQGDLTISNFNAEGVPAPLSVLGAGAAFGWIRRRRAQIKVHPSFHL